ncbi:glycoside hydrolase family 65 protein [Amorphoplanes nipponensis]|uniref:Kojibiose phosphorylase n=1 Tax=Actinoplanes nipponensis TaxID=135950 RepID=A0A919JPG5_9ACTN|nr:glycoside hydrolase family 65 protein [Actinoplanes nipponensis]GIE54538.1 kojibiose phosphorylase [Actinoplanes nipponensis]
MDVDGDGADPRWQVVEDGFDPARANTYETIFTVGNGYLGTRGALEEGHEGALPGTFLRGVFDHHDSAVIDLVKAPDWTALVVVVDGVRLDVTSASVVRHRRVLDLRAGVLARETVFADAAGRRTRVETIRFASGADQHLCCLRARITPENHSAWITVHSGIDGTHHNLDRRPFYAEPPPADPQMKWHKWAKSKHLDEVARAELPGGVYLETRTIDTLITIGYATATTVSPPAETTVAQRHRAVEQVSRVRVAAGETLTVEKLATIYTSRDVPAADVRRRCQDELRGHLAAGFAACRDRNRAAWAARWADCDITIDGDAEASRAVRFNTYELLIAANESDPRVNIGANALTGERYRGHAFWDTEVFMLPFYIYTRPETARALLLYRFHTLDGARRNARATGFRGARYAWESADTGVETTPQWTVDGAHRIWMGEEEIHITSAVAYGLIAYLAATGDHALMTDYGAEILFETSRFWADRLEATPEGRYVLSRVVGPDEFHEHVDNSAYTNHLVRWHLRRAAQAYAELAISHPGELASLAERIGLTRAEVDDWLTRAERIHLPGVTADGVIEQFDGYFGLDTLPVEHDDNDMPRYPPGHHHYNLGGTKLIKQADVVMLTYLLPDEFSDAAKRANYEYYEPLTLHKSSLSPATYSIMSIEVGDPGRAVQYFRRSATVDLVDNQGNTEEGIHIASAGGTWQMVVNGFGGFRVRNGRMTFKPWLPPGWDALAFRLRWHGHTVSVSTSPTAATFVLSGPEGLRETILVDGREVTLPANAEVVVDLAPRP